MCGVWSWFEPLCPLDRKRFEAALETLKSRGPDGAHALFLNAHLGLGHTRLGIRDRQAGIQPFWSPDGQVVAVVNGELYDTDPLYALLQARGLRLKTCCDSELVPALYQMLGPAFIEQLTGEFALILYDVRQNKLWAARDRFGVKPLCWARTPTGGLCVASQAKAIFAAGVQASWSPEALRQTLALQYVLPEQTLFKGVHSLAPGTLLCFDLSDSASAPVTHTYWQIPDAPRGSIEEGLKKDAEVKVEDFLATLQTCIQQRANVSEARAGGHLSGGIDSSTVAYFSRRSHPDFTGFTLAFPSLGAADIETPHLNETNPLNEVDKALAFAHREGFALEKVSITPQAVAEVYAAAVRASEGVAINGHLSAKYLLNQRMRALGFRVALTGEGADELLYGYSHFRADLGLPDAGGQSQRQRGLHLPAGEALSLELFEQEVGYAPFFLRAKACQGWRVLQLMEDNRPASFAPAISAIVKLMYQRRHLSRENLSGQGSRWLWCQLALQGYILRTLGDGCEMAHGIEGRPPFLDHRLFEQLQHLAPAHHFLHTAGRSGSGALEKRLLRQAMTQRLSKSLIQRPKQPLNAPPLTLSLWWQRHLKTVLLSLPLPPGVRRKKLEELLDRLPTLSYAEHVQWDAVLHLLLSLTYLQEAYL